MPALWFDKFCDRWRIKEDASWSMTSGKDGEGGGPKLEWIKTLTSNRVGVQDEIEVYASRLARLVERRKGRYGVFVSESRFVTGLGRSHPVENGFAWHPTLGTPCLPGSSIKGAVRAWAKLNATPPVSRETVHRLFGGPESGGPRLFPGCRSRRARPARVRRDDSPLRRLGGEGASR